MNVLYIDLTEVLTVCRMGIVSILGMDGVIELKVSYLMHSTFYNDISKGLKLVELSIHVRRATGGTAIPRAVLKVQK